MCVDRKLTQLFPCFKKELTEKRRLSNSGITNTSFNLRTYFDPLVHDMGIMMSPMVLQRILVPSARYTCFLVGLILVQSDLKGVMCADAPLSTVQPFSRSVAGYCFWNAIFSSTL